MDELGFTLKFSEPEKPWAGWMQAGVDRPLFLIGSPYNGERTVMDKWWLYSLRTEVLWTGAPPKPSPMRTKRRRTRSEAALSS